MVTTKRRLVANSASGLAERFLNLFVQVWLYQHLIKRISPEEYSLYPVVTALLVFVSPLLVALVSGLGRYTVEAYTRHDHRRVTEITSTMFPLLLAFGLGLVLLAFLVTKHLGSILNIAPQQLSEGRLMVLLLLGSLALSVTLIPFRVGLYVQQKFVMINLLNVSQTLIRTGLLFALLFGAGTRVIWVVVAAVVADVIIVVTTAVLSVRMLPALKFRFECIRWELVSTLMAFGFWNMIASIAALIRKSSDLLILNRYATPIDVNTFHLASLTDNQIDAALDKMNEPMAPHMVAVHTSGGATALQTAVTRGGRYSMWAALFVATPLVAFRQQLWSHYLGSQFEVYAKVSLVMVLLLARYWIECPLYLMGKAAYATGRVRTFALLIIASSVSNVAFTVYLIHFLHMGAVGSALGTLIAVLIWDPLVMWKFGLKLLGLELGAWFKATVWRGALPSLVAGLFAWGWNYWLRPQRIPELVLAAAIVATAYVLMILLFCLDEDEYRHLKGLFTNGSSPEAFPVLAPRNES